MYTSGRSNLGRSDGKRKSADAKDGAATVAAQADGALVCAIRGERPGAVFEHVRASIVRGRLAPGPPLMEVEIAERRGVSRTPVRDALQRLHAAGLSVRTKR